jgi:integrase
MKRLPTYRFHRASNQAICCILGRTYYLGEFDSKESRDKFNRLVAEYLTNPSFGIEKGRQSIAESVVAFLKHAKSYYGEGSEFEKYSRALAPMVELYSDLNIRDFGIQEFKAIREQWVRKKHAREYVNKQAKRIIAFVKWLVGEGMLEPTVHQALRCVQPLKKGRCNCPESEPVRPVDEATIEKTIPHLSPVVADMVRLQSLIGCRPGELVKLKPAMVDTSGSVWVITIEEHKNSWRGHLRKIYVGPKAQAILKPYLDRPKDAFCFSPAESMEQRLQARASNRITAMSCGNRRGSNRVSSPKKKPGQSYSTITYCKAIHYACRKARIPLWSPNQLRHKVATELREREGVESASVILGHAHLPTTEIYAEASTKKALEVALRHG